MNKVIRAHPASAEASSNKFQPKSELWAYDRAFPQQGRVTLLALTTRGQRIVSRKALLKETFGVKEDSYRVVGLELLNM